MAIGTQRIQTLFQTVKQEAPTEPKGGQWGGTALLLVGGVILPLGTFLIELLTHMCAEAFFDPMPTFAHQVLVLAVPAANFLLFGCVAGWWRTPWRLVAPIAGFSIGISAYFALVFVPLIPLALIAILFFGWGFLPLAPLLSFITAILLLTRVRSLARERRTVGGGLATLAGFAAAALFVGLLSFTAALTDRALEQAASDDPRQRVRGLDTLRDWGDRERLLEACYRRRRHWFPGAQPFTSSTDVSPAVAQRVYYEVTGQPYDQARAPASVSRTADRVWDGNVGSSRVGPALQGLSLGESLMEVQVHGDAALAYTEWQMEFRNFSRLDREARAVVQLPPGGVVSRATLWIDGEEHEAAFGGRAQTTQAYRSVVNRRRDPLLVTTAGHDRILVQCFPVPVGAQMRIRLGITQPLDADGEWASLSVPTFMERNFAVPPDKRFLRIAGDAELRDLAKGLKTVGGGARGSVAAETVRVAAVRVWADAMRVADPLDRERAVIRQAIVTERLKPPSALTVVVDGSATLGPYAREIEGALTALRSGPRIRVLVAHDDTHDVTGRPDSVANFAFVGGADNSLALARAIENAPTRERAAVIWIHGPQPLAPSGRTRLEAAWRRAETNVTLYDVPLAPGPNRVLEALESVGPVQHIRRESSLAMTLERIGMAAMSAPHVGRRKLQRIGVRGFAPPESTPYDTHLAALWANSRVLELLRDGDPTDKSEAVGLATAYRVVTPVSGAVVLENQRQYDQFGLDNPNAPSSPNVPEPATWVLMALGLLALLAASRKGRRPYPNHQGATHV